MNRQTGVGWLFRRDPVRARAELLTALELSGGNLRRAASLVLASRRNLYRWVERAKLWPEVDRLRVQHRARPPELAKAIATCGG